MILNTTRSLPAQEKLKASLSRTLDGSSLMVELHTSRHFQMLRLKAMSQTSAKKLASTAELGHTRGLFGYRVIPGMVSCSDMQNSDLKTYFSSSSLDGSNPSSGQGTRFFLPWPHTYWHQGRPFTTLFKVPVPTRRSLVTKTRHKTIPHREYSLSSLVYVGYFMLIQRQTISSFAQSMLIPQFHRAQAKIPKVSYILFFFPSTSVIQEE